MKHCFLQPLLIPFTALVYIAQLFILPFYRPTSIRWYAGCFELIAGRTVSKDPYDAGRERTLIWGRPAGQSWGIRVIWYSSERARDHAPLRVHERVHALHGEWVNAAAHLVLVPLSLLLGGGWWTVAAIGLGQVAFGIAYGGHFFIEWARGGFGGWYSAYMKTWSEVVAYRIDDEYERGKRPGAWGE